MIKFKTKLFYLIILSLFFIFLFFFFIKSNYDTNLEKFETISKELNILNWEDYTGTPEILIEFENKYNIKINIDTYEIETEIFEKDLSKYDLVLTSETQIFELINQKLITNLNLNYLNNTKYLSSDCILSEPYSNYFIPYVWGTTGIIVNEKFIPNHKTSWDILWDKKYQNKTMMLYNIEEIIIATTMNTNSKIYPETKQEFETDKDFILHQKKVLYGYYNNLDELSNLFKSESVWAAQAYSGDLVELETSENLTYYIPREGTNKWIDGFVIPKTSPNKYTAYLFTNFLLEEKNNAIIAQNYEIPTCNENSKKYLSDDFLSDDSIYPDVFVKDKLKFALDYKLNSKFSELKKELFNQLQK